MGLPQRRYRIILFIGRSIINKFVFRAVVYLPRFFCVQNRKNIDVVGKTGQKGEFV